MGRCGLQPELRVEYAIEVVIGNAGMSSKSRDLLAIAGRGL